MPLESATYVDDLVSTNPLGTDDVSLGDDHIRLIKSVLKNTFPNLDGALTTKLAVLNGVSQLITVGSDGEALKFNWPSGGTVAQVTNWTSASPVPANQAEQRYIASTDGGSDTYNIQQMKINSDTGLLGAQTRDGTWHYAQANGNYSSSTDLSGEAEAREAADHDLQQQINNRVLKTGDTSTGGQTLSNRYSSGGLHWAPGVTSVISGMSGGKSIGDYSFGLFAQTQDGAYTGGILSVNGFQGHKDFRFNEDGNIFTPLGTVALTSELPSLPFQTLKSWTLTHVNSMTRFQLPQRYKTPPLMWAQDVSSRDVHYACIRNITTTDYFIQTASNDWIPELQIFCLGDPA